MTDQEQPLIGISSQVVPLEILGRETLIVGTLAHYTTAVTRAGGVPVLLPPSSGDPARILRRLGGLVLPGGPDIDPALYGQARHETTRPARGGRDEWEYRLVTSALQVDLPVLGICRGLQMLNVALGGTLHQHLPDIDGKLFHNARFGEVNLLDMEVEPASRLASIVGPRTSGNCRHHQAIDRLADGLTAVAWAEDKTIEAAESPDHRFVLGVQWHPEDFENDDPLMSALVAAADLGD